MLIREVSEKTGITSDTLRYYEKIGLIKNISRDKNGIRKLKYKIQNYEKIFNKR